MAAASCPAGWAGTGAGDAVLYNDGPPPPGRVFGRLESVPWGICGILRAVPELVKCLLASSWFVSLPNTKSTHCHCPYLTLT